MITNFIHFFFARLPLFFATMPLWGEKKKKETKKRPEATNPASMPNYLSSGINPTSPTARRNSQKVIDLFDKIDLNGDGELERHEVVSCAKMIDMTDAEAGDFFDRLDNRKRGRLLRSEWNTHAESGLSKFMHGKKNLKVRDRASSCISIFQCLLK